MTALSPAARPSALEDRRAWIALAAVNGIGDVRFGRLVGSYGGATGVLEASLRGTPAQVQWRFEERAGARLPLEVVDRIREAAADPDAVERRCRELGVATVTPLDIAYPARLLELDPPPPVLYLQGAMGRAGGRAERGGRGDPATHGRGARAGGAGRDAARGVRRGRGVRVGDRGRWCRARRRDGGRRTHHGGHRRRPCDPGTACEPISAPADPGHRWRAHRGAATGRATVTRHLSAAQQDHQHPRRCHDRDRGAQSQRCAHHRPPCTGAGSAGARRTGPPGGSGHRRAALRCSARRPPDRSSGSTKWCRTSGTTCPGRARKEWKARVAREARRTPGTR